MVGSGPAAMGEVPYPSAAGDCVADDGGYISAGASDCAKVNRPTPFYAATASCTGAAKLSGLSSIASPRGTYRVAGAPDRAPANAVSKLCVPRATPPVVGDGASAA